MNRQNVVFGLIVGLAIVIVAVALVYGSVGNVISMATGQFSKPANAIEVQVIYALEMELFVPDFITAFNRACAQGRNPVTGQGLGMNEQPVCVEGKNASSGTMAQGIVNAILAPNNANVERPTLFAPSASRIKAVLLLSDGQDTASQASLNQVVRVISNAHNSRMSVLVIPVAYGSDADVNALSNIARASDTRVQSGDAQNIKPILEITGSYF